MKNPCPEVVEHLKNDDPENKNWQYSICGTCGFANDECNRCRFGTWGDWTEPNTHTWGESEKLVFGKIKPLDGACPRHVFDKSLLESI